MISSPSEVSRIDLNFSLITKVKYGCFVKETTLFYHKFANFTRIGDFTWGVV